MDSLHADGHGSAIEFDGQTITLIAGKSLARRWHAERMIIPRGDVVDIEFRDATAMVNGYMVFTTAHASSAYREPTSDTAPRGRASDPLLAVQWRLGERDPFRRVYAAIGPVHAEPDAIVRLRAAHRAEVKANTAAGRRR